jgi:hypothetical protein
MHHDNGIISETRRAAETPKRIIDAEGKAVFGTFQSEFEELNLLDAAHPTSVPDWLNKERLTLWEATEVNLKEGVLLAVICDMGLFGKTLNVFWDRRTNRIYYFDTNLPSEETCIAPNLIGNCIAHARTENSEVQYVNAFDHGRVSLSGQHEGTDGSMAYRFQLNKVCQPSIVSIPFGDNRPLYTEKQMFTVTGELTLNGETFTADESCTAIIDDHRGYYPRKMHYDWVTGMANTAQYGCLGVNLTRNQSIDQVRYNENLIFMEQENSLLPPVYFKRNPESKDFHGQGRWHIRDDHHMVNVNFHVQNQLPMIIHAGAVNVDYYIQFGELSGYVRMEDGTRIILDGMMGMGEDKSMLL